MLPDQRGHKSHQRIRGGTRSMSAALGCIHRISSVKGDITNPLCFRALTPHSNILLNGLHTAEAPLRNARQQKWQTGMYELDLFIKQLYMVMFQMSKLKISPFIHLNFDISSWDFFRETRGLKAEGRDERSQHTSPSPALGLRSRTRPQWWNQWNCSQLMQSNHTFRLHCGAPLLTERKRRDASLWSHCSFLRDTVAAIVQLA